MEQPNEPDTSIGSGDGETPILASGKPSTEAGSKPSRKPSKPAEGNTKPVSIPEALSLLQTLCLDLRSLGCETAILARGSRLYVVLSVPSDTGSVGTRDGHITLGNAPVSNIGQPTPESRNE